MKRILVFIVRGYKKLVSPFITSCCRYTPTCSEYSAEAIESFGVVKGLSLSIWRLLRCNPFGGSGLDQVRKK